MSYENPPVPHEVNVSRESVPAEFLKLALGLALVIVFVTGLLFIAGGWLARFVPYSMESEWIGQRVLGVAMLEQDVRGDPAQSAAIRTYVRKVAQRMSGAMHLPAGMRLRVHFSESEIPNAFATLGGHIVVTRGLYQRMPSENALAFVLAHEIAHIKARDPISAVGGGATLALLFVLVGGDVDTLAPQIANVVQLGYSRRAEARADTEALAAVRTVYGHAGGTAAVFEALADFQRATLGGVSVPTLLSTHPADAARIARLQAAGRDWDPRTPLVPLAVPVRSGLKAAVGNGSQRDSRTPTR